MKNATAQKGIDQITKGGFIRYFKKFYEVYNMTDGCFHCIQVNAETGKRYAAHTGTLITFRDSTIELGLKVGQIEIL